MNFIQYNYSDLYSASMAIQATQERFTLFKSTLKLKIQQTKNESKFLRLK